MPEPTQAALAAWLEARGSEPGPLFVNFDRAGKGHRLTGTAVYHIVGWLGAKAGLTVRPQELRHLAITTALDRTNGDVRAVANSPATRTCAPSAATATTDRPRRQGRQPCRCRMSCERQIIY